MPFFIVWDFNSSELLPIHSSHGFRRGTDIYCRERRPDSCLDALCCRNSHSKINR